MPVLKALKTKTLFGNDLVITCLISSEAKDDLYQLIIIEISSHSLISSRLLSEFPGPIFVYLSSLACLKSLSSVRLFTIVNLSCFDYEIFIFTQLFIQIFYLLPRSPTKFDSFTILRISIYLPTKLSHALKYFIVRSAPVPHPSKVA